MYQNTLQSCGHKHVVWNVEIKELPGKVIFLNGLKWEVRRTN